MGGGAVAGLDHCQHHHTPNETFLAPLSHCGYITDIIPGGTEGFSSSQASQQLDSLGRNMLFFVKRVIIECP